MARSTKLITAAYIMAFVASKAPRRLNTDLVAKMVKAHPTRVRHITSTLTKAGLLKSYRGASGGLTIARPGEEITLLDIYDAIQEGPMLTPGEHDPFSEWASHCLVRPTFQGIYAGVENDMRARLADVRLTDLYRPWHDDTLPTAAES